MAPAVLFTKEVYGKDHLVRGSVKRPTPEFLAKTPMSPKLRAELDKLMNGKENYLAGKSEAEQIAFLQSMSYRDYLLKVVGVSEDCLFFGKGDRKSTRLNSSH